MSKVQMDGMDFSVLSAILVVDGAGAKDCYWRTLEILFYVEEKIELQRWR